MADKIWAEFNTLSVLYGKPSQTFIAAGEFIAVCAQPRWLHCFLRVTPLNDL